VPTRLRRVAHSNGRAIRLGIRTTVNAGRRATIIWHFHPDYGDVAARGLAERGGAAKSLAALPLSRPGRRGMTPSVYYNLEQKFKITKLATKISEPQVRTLFAVAVPSSTFAASAARDGQSQFRPSWSVWDFWRRF